MKISSFKIQLRHHQVALISLAIALIALLYTAWREEVTERNRNIRTAGFEVIKNLGELQLTVNYMHFQPENTMANPYVAWGRIALVSDLAKFLPSPAPEKVSQMVEIWKNNWQKIKTDEAAADQVSEAIDAARDAVVSVLFSLR